MPATADSPIKAVLFDCDGVLQWPVAGWIEVPTRSWSAGRSRSSTCEQTSAVTGRCRSGRGRRVFGRARRDRRGRRAAAEWHKYDVWADSLALVDQVRERGVRCYVASNQQSDRLAYMRDHNGYERHFDEQFYSRELGVAKPDVAFSTTVLRGIRTPAEETLFIDDKQANGGRRGVRADDRGRLDRGRGLTDGGASAGARAAGRLRRPLVLRGA